MSKIWLNSYPAGVPEEIPEPEFRSIREMVEHSFQEWPDRPSYTNMGTTITYRELDERANRLAHHLREQGVEADTPVALCLERSPELIVAILGILKAGAGYLPLDPTYPDTRLAYMLENARDEFAASLIKHLFAYALGRELHPEDGEELDAILVKVRAGGYSMRSVLKAVALSPSISISGLETWCTAKGTRLLAAAKNSRMPSRPSA